MFNHHLYYDEYIYICIICSILSVYLVKFFGIVSLNVLPLSHKHPMRPFLHRPLKAQPLNLKIILMLQYNLYKEVFEPN